MGGVARPTCATSHNAVEYEYAGGSSAASLPFIQKELSNRCPVSFFGAPAAILLSAGKHQVSSIQNLHFRLTFFCVFEYFLLSKLHDPHFPMGRVPPPGGPRSRSISSFVLSSHLEWARSVTAASSILAPVSPTTNNTTGRIVLGWSPATVDGNCTARAPPPPGGWPRTARGRWGMPRCR